MISSVPVYYEFARIAFLKILAYRLRYFTGILTYFVNISVYYFIWHAIFENSTQVAGYDLQQMVTYVAIGWIIRSFYFNNVDREIATEVLDGKIAMHLIKPVDSQFMYLAQTVGESCFRVLMFTAPIAIVVFGVYRILPPPSILAGGLFVMSSFFALVLFAMINFFVGTLALQLYSIVGVIRAKYFIVEFLSGLLIPISFFPVPLQKVLAFLPFPHISYTPLQIYLGRIEGLTALSAIGLQLAWIGAAGILGRVWWQFSIRRLSIQGG